MKNQSVEKLSIWQNKTFLILFSSYSISTLGRFFDMLAVMLMFSYVWQAEPWLISMIPVAYAVPYALFSQFSGIFVDRGKKVKIMLTADLLTAVCTIAMIFTFNPWVMLGIIFVRATISTVHFPAQQALVKQVVHEDLLMKAVTLNGTVNQLSKVIGPFVGASIAAAFSPRVSFAIYAVFLLISVGVLLLVRHIDREDSNRFLENGDVEPETYWKSWRGNWRSIFQSKALWVSFSFSLIAFLAIQLIDAQFVVLTRELFPHHPSIFGWLISVVGLGAVTILLFLNRLTEIKRYGLFLGSAVFLIGSGIFAMGMMWMDTEIWMILLAGLIIGVGTGIFSVVFSYILQVESPEGKVGQLSGMYESLTGIILIVAPVTGGLLVQLFGVFTIFQVVGAVTFGIGLIGLVFQRWLWGSRRRGKEKSVKVAQ